jgi:hypothetical protein
MSKMRNLSICLSDIPADAIKEGKNGKKYLSLTTYDNDQPDNYGNDFAVWISQTKEERDAKVNRKYLGNGKIVVASSGGNAAAKPKTTDGLPF